MSPLGATFRPKRNKMTQKLDSISSQKIRNLARHGFTPLRGRLYQKNPRLRSKHFEEHCLEESYLMEVRILGSSLILNPFQTDTVPIIFSHRKATPVRLSSVKRAEKRQRLEICVCRYNAYYEGCFLSRFLSFYAWLGTKLTYFFRPFIFFKVFLTYLTVILVI